MSCKLEYISDYPPLYNDPEITAGVVAAIENSTESEINTMIEFPMFSGSEDFSYYTAKFPGCFFYIGCKPKGVEKPYFNHHPKWDIDEDALLVAAKAVAEVVCSHTE